MSEYEVTVAVSGEMVLEGVGRVEFSYEAGRVKAGSPTDLIVLERLAAAGIASMAPPPASKNHQKAVADAPVATEEE